MEVAAISARLEEARGRIRSFASLLAGWDDSDALPVSDNSIEKASTLLNLFSSAKELPKIYPTPKGGIQFEYEGANDYLELEIVGNSVTCYVESEDREHVVDDQNELIRAVIDAN